jgi:hypothetical protein
MQEMQTFAPAYNLTLVTSIFADLNKPDYEADLAPILKFNVQTIVMMMPAYDAVVML